MSLSKTMRQLMTQKGLRVSDLSRKSGVPAKTIYHWLAGQQPRKMDHLFKICEILEISVEELYGQPPRARSHPGRNIFEELQMGTYEVILRPLAPYKKTPGL